MKIHAITDDTNAEAIEVLKSGITSDMLKNDGLCDNYLYERRHHPANLFYWLANGRYKNGCMYVVSDSNGFVACSGWYQYAPDTAIVLNRMLINPVHRTKYVVGNLLLPKMIEQTKQYDNVWITCNEYNKSIYNWFNRAAEGKSPALFKNWPDIYKAFKPIGQHKVNGILQYVVALER